MPVWIFPTKLWKPIQTAPVVAALFFINNENHEFVYHPKRTVYSSKGECALNFTDKQAKGLDQSPRQSQTDLQEQWGRSSTEHPESTHGLSC